MSTKKRSFKLHAVGKHENKETSFKPGRYMGRDPASAAKKAFSQLCKAKKIKGRCTLNIAIKEITTGSKHKVYTYRAKRHKLKEPKIFKKNTPQQYVVEYDNTIHTNKDFDYTQLIKKKVELNE